MVDATYPKAQPTASNLGVKKGGWDRLIGCTKSGMNNKLHTVSDANGRAISFVISAGQASDYNGATAPLDTLPKRNGCWAIEDMMRTGSKMPCRKWYYPCILGRKNRTNPSNKISAATKGVIGSKSCLAVLKIG